MRRTNRATELGLLTILFLSLLAIAPVRVLAAGETYSLTASPDNVQESSLSGAGLFLNVDNARPNQPYEFEWTVTDPSNNSRTAINSTITAPGQASFTLSLVYPRDFGGAQLNLVGTYAVSVNPPSLPNVATGQFEVIITDRVSYQRTASVSVEAIRYDPNDNVTINIAKDSVSLTGFPAWKLADSAGVFSFQWEIPVQAPLGTYTVTLSGLTTIKYRPDSQSFTVQPASLAVPQLEMDRISFQRSDTADFYFRATYPSGLQLQYGSGVIRLTMPNSSTVQIFPGYDSIVGVFHASYPIPLSTQTGPWAATLEPRSLDDGYGNTGPETSQSRGFTVQPAYVTVSLSLGNQTYVSGDTIVLRANVTNQDGTRFTSGKVNASLSLPGVQAARSIELSYDQTAQRWIGNFVISATDPSGLWLVEVTASDPYGNQGTGSSSLTISALPLLSSAQATILFYLVVAAIGVAASALAVFFWARRRITRRELHVDMKVVDGEVRRVQEEDFFRRIKEQVRDEKESEKGRK